MKKMICLLLALCLGIGAGLSEGMKVLSFSDSGLETETEGVRFENGVLTILQPGEYMLCGELTNGQIFVNSAEEGRVTLYLNGVKIHNETSSAILIRDCQPRAVISLVEGTENTLSCGDDLVFTEEDEPNGVIFSDSDLTLEGNGSLNITAGAMDGIVSKDDLKIMGGTITVEAPRHGIRGKDCVEIYDGALNITAGRDGIKSTNKNDPERGYVAIRGGTVHITYGDEPVQVITDCAIENAKVTFRVKD